MMYGYHIVYNNNCCINEQIEKYMINILTKNKGCFSVCIFIQNEHMSLTNRTIHLSHLLLSIQQTIKSTKINALCKNVLYKKTSISLFMSCRCGVLYGATCFY